MDGVPIPQLSSRANQLQNSSPSTPERASVLSCDILTSSKLRSTVIICLYLGSAIAGEYWQLWFGLWCDFGPLSYAERWRAEACSATPCHRRIARVKWIGTEKMWRTFYYKIHHVQYAATWLKLKNRESDLQMLLLPTCGRVALPFPNMLYT